jgi:hypothetical protein
MLSVVYQANMPYIFCIMTFAFPCLVFLLAFSLMSDPSRDGRSSVVFRNSHMARSHPFPVRFFHEKSLTIFLLKPYFWISFTGV